MAVNDILDIGRQGITSNQRALQTTAGNIANANTPGYTRRRAVMETLNGNIAHGIQIGGGVECKKVVRIHDAFVEKQIVDESHALGGARAKSEGLRRVENSVAKDGEALNEMVNKFFNDMRDLSVNPETSTMRNIVQSSAQGLADGFRTMNDSLEGLRHDLDLRIGDNLGQINTMTKQIASLNDTIVQAESRNEIPNDLYDKRDLLMRDLSTKLDFQTATDQRGQVMIIAGGSTLVQGNDSFDLFALRTPETPDKAAGSLDVFVSNKGGGRQVTTGIKDGELGGMLFVRDQVINPALRHLDKVAYQVATSVNSVHREGVGLDGVGNRNLFNEPINETGAAAFFALSSDVKSNHETIAAGLEGDSPGDNRIALKISQLQNDKVLETTNLGSAEHHTINESINSLVGGVGVHAQREGSMFQHQQSVVDQLNNYREAISGVSLEEEAINMIQYQTVFNASAKAMKVGEELFDTILSLKR